MLVCMCNGYDHSKGSIIIRRVTSSEEDHINLLEKLFLSHSYCIIMQIYIRIEFTHVQTFQLIKSLSCLPVLL